MRRLKQKFSMEISIGSGDLESAEINFIAQTIHPCLVRVVEVETVAPEFVERILQCYNVIDHWEHGRLPFKQLLFLERQEICYIFFHKSIYISKLKMKIPLQ